MACIVELLIYGCQLVKFGYCVTILSPVIDITFDKDMKQDKLYLRFLIVKEA